MLQRLLNKNLIIIFLFISSEVFAQQETTTFTEKNLPDKTIEKTEKNTETKPDPIVTPNKIQDAISSILLNKQASSLMFDDEENSNIDRAVESLKNNQIYTPEEDDEKDGPNKKNEEEEKLKLEEKKSQENEKSYIYLASIIYFSSKDWAVWINEQKITSETNKSDKELYLKSVQKDHVRLVWKLSISKWKILSGRKSEDMAPKINKDNKVEVEFELRPNQTFILSTNNVVEGRAVIALLRKKEEEKKQKTTGTQAETNSQQ